MEYFAGLDVSVNDTSVCIVDETGKIVREVKVASEPDALLAVLMSPHYITTSSGSAGLSPKPHASGRAFYAAALAVLFN